MKISIGSKNNIKIEAIKEILPNYEVFKSIKNINAIDAPDIYGQPMSLLETIEGAKHRAKISFINCDYSFGIEDGLMEVPHTKNGFMNICACAIFDGKEYHLGISSAFEVPRSVINLMIKEKLDMSQAYKKAGLTKEEKVGVSNGAVGLLTKSRVNRKQYTIQALTMALIHLDNEGLF